MFERRLGATLAGLSAAILAFSIAAPTASAKELQATGTPPNLGSGQTGYYVWSDGHDLHLRMSDGDASAVLRGTLRTNGKLARMGLDGNRNAEHVAITDHGHMLHFRVRPGATQDGFDVRVEDSTSVDVRLRRNGGDAPTDHVWLGSSDSHPDTSSFTLHV